MTRLRLVFTTVVLLMIGIDLRGTVAPPVRVSLEVVGNPIDGSAGSRCAISQDFAKAGRVDSWIEVWPKQAAGGPAEIRCGTGSRLSNKGPNRATELPYLAADLVTSAFPLAQLGVRAFNVELSISGRKSSGSAAAGEPKYELFSEKRKLFFNEGGNAFLPLLISDERDQAELGLLETLVNIGVNRVRGEGAAYGSVTVKSDVAGARIFLDGGATTLATTDGGVTLANVLAGDRELLARDSKGRTVRKWAGVLKDRRSVVSLNFETTTDKPFGVVSVGKNAQGFDEYRRSRDGALVIKIPAGEFLMGNKKTEREPFEHRVELSEYLIDKNEVSWEQFLKFAEATETPLPPHEPYWGIHDDQPAVFVTWEEAKAYCEWTGGRLPTEAEWEKAARGTDERMYPWGNEEPDPDRGVFRRSWGLIATDPVGAHPSGVSPYGLLDTGGNVWEWCSDWYDGGYYEVSPPKDPKGPAPGQARVVRGGSWDSRPAVLSASCRNWGPRGYREGDFGFRCAMDSPR
jgi:sulfatase modifying factor 1